MVKHKLLSILAVIFAVSMAVSVSILNAELDLGASHLYDIADAAVPIGFLTLLAGAALSGRNLDNVAIWEIVLGLIPVGVLTLLFFDVGFMTELISNEHPWSGLVALVLSYAAFWSWAFRRPSGGS